MNCRRLVHTFPLPNKAGVAGSRFGFEIPTTREALARPNSLNDLNIAALPLAAASRPPPAQPPPVTTQTQTCPPQRQEIQDKLAKTTISLSGNKISGDDS